MAKTFKGWLGKLALLLFSTLLSLEAGSYAYLTIRQRSGIDLEPYIRKEILPFYVEFAKRGPDKIMVPHERLGWYRAPSSSGTVGKNLYITDDDGARHVPRASGPRLVSTYGDSFTEGLEVDNDKTWPAQLSYQLGITVQNYAVSGYGPDQALLYLEENMTSGKRTPIVILAFIPENLNRLVSAFRPFYTYPRTDFVSFKPMFLETQSGHFETKYFAPADLSADALVKAAREASAVDHWFKVAGTYSATDIRRFPYSLALARSRDRQTDDERSRPLAAPPPTAKAVMRYVIQRFYADSRKYQFTPVVAAIPGDPTDFRDGIKGLEEIFSQTLPDLVYLDASRGVTRAPNGEYGDMFGDTHYSIKANVEVARVVRTQILQYVDALRSREGFEDSTVRPVLTIFDQTGSFGQFGAGWYPEESAGLVRWRWSGGPRSAVDVQTRSAGAMTMTFRCKALEAPGAPDQQIEVLVNSRKVGTVKVLTEERSYTVEVPASAIKVGTNTLEFAYRWSRTPQSIGGGSDSRSLAVVWYELKLTPR